MKPAVTWLKNASLELYKQGEGGRERDRKSKWWLWTRVSVSCLTRRTIPTEQRGYKNTFGHLTNFRCVELFQICSLSFVRLRLRDQFRPADMEKSLAYTSISLTPIAHYSIDTHWGAHVHSSPIHTHITHNHNQDFSSSCEIKGRTSVWHYHLYYLSIYLYIYLSWEAFELQNTLKLQNMCNTWTGMEKAAATLYEILLDYPATRNKPSV